VEGEETDARPESHPLLDPVATQQPRVHATER
jgi:hypothetical protein